jgi:hypothetical protein
MRPCAGRSADGVSRHRKSALETTFRPERPPESAKGQWGMRIGASRLAASRRRERIRRLALLSIVGCGERM